MPFRVPEKGRSIDNAEIFCCWGEECRRWRAWRVSADLSIFSWSALPGLARLRNREPSPRQPAQAGPCAFLPENVPPKENSTMVENAEIEDADSRRLKGRKTDRISPYFWLGLEFTVWNNGQRPFLSDCKQSGNTEKKPIDRYLLKKSGSWDRLLAQIGSHPEKRRKTSFMGYKGCFYPLLTEIWKNQRYIREAF
jgi:hypothetical protein